MGVNSARLITFVALLAAFGLAAAIPSIVAAAPGNGAVTGGGPYNVHGCSEDSGYTFCIDVLGETRYVRIPTGGYHSQINLRSLCSTITDDATGEVVQVTCNVGHGQFHLDSDGNPQVITVHETSSDVFPGFTLCLVMTYHLANGAVQYGSTVTDC